MATTHLAFLLLVLVLACSGAARGFDLPGVAPVDFRKKDLLAVKVSQLSSIKTQLPYSYYSLPFCRPRTVTNSAKNLGEVLRGDLIESSLYEFEMMEPKLCQIVCKIVLSEEGAKDFMEKIEDEYRVNMILDNLPTVVRIMMLYPKEPLFYQQGVHVGAKGMYSGSNYTSYFIYNHFSFLVKYNKVAHTDLARIVAFEVRPYSVTHEFDGEWKGNATRLKTCDPQSRNLVVSSDGPQEIEANKDIIFTYDINFQESDIEWASRWDTYNLVSNDHYFPIVNSLTMVLFLSGTIAMILLRTLYRDISRYNQLESQEVTQEETGWKLVHGDVFRPPANTDLLCVYVGTGVQLFGTAVVTLLFSILGLVWSCNRGGLITTMLLLWVFMGLFAGYSTARLYKAFRGSEWKKITVKTAMMFPGAVFVVFFVLNALLWGKKSSSAVPFTTMFTLVLLWFGVSVPLVFVGSYLGFNKPAMEDPVRTNKIPRPVPEQPWYMRNPVISVLIPGILPFGAVLVEFFFILTSIWLHQFYFTFGFLFLVLVVLTLTCASVTILLCYFQLCSEDYHWWWRSYLTSGSSAVYLFLYATFYFFANLEITKAVPSALYFGYMLVASYAFFVLTGTIGFCACFWFTRLIYSSLKID